MWGIIKKGQLRKGRSSLMLFRCDYAATTIIIIKGIKRLSWIDFGYEKYTRGYQGTLGYPKATFVLQFGSGSIL